MSTLDSIRPASDGTWGIGISGSDLVRYPPEPRNSVAGWGRRLPVLFRRLWEEL